MKITKTLRAAMAALLALILCAQGLPSAYAANEPASGKDCSLAVRFAPNDEAMVGVKFEAWRVGELTQNEWKLLEKIEGYKVLSSDPESWKDNNKAITLLGYLHRDSVQPDCTAVTDSEGMARFGQVEQGLYLVQGEGSSRGETNYTPTPFLVTVPYEDKTDVMTNTKFTSSPKPNTPDNPNTPDTVDRHVLKSWNDTGHRNQRPDEIVVDLLRDGEVYDTVTLTADSNWRHDWTGLDADSQWMVVEQETGNYTVLVEQMGITFLITNTWPDPRNPGNPGEPPPPDEDIPDDPTPLDGPPPEEPPEEEIFDDEPPLADLPDLPKTGQLWWPVVPMVVGGLVLIAVGWKRRRDGSASDET